MTSRAGTGDWYEWSISLETVIKAAEDWKSQLSQISNPWLCWNISPTWCVIQQKLVNSVGWTPVVGYDPRVGLPPLIPGAVLIDFNKHFQLPEVRMHIPIEFAFLFADKLAFWHSDLLCRPSVMADLAHTFNTLGDGDMAAVKEKPGFRRILSFRHHRYWEVVGCMTRGASVSLFHSGTGWWRNFALHQNCPTPKERERRKRYHWENGIGIMYWKKHYGGRVIDIDQSLVDEGHATAIGNKRYITLKAERSSSDRIFDLDMNYDVRSFAKNLGLAEFLNQTTDAEKQTKQTRERVTE